LKCKNRRCKAQYQTSVTFEQVTIRRRIAQSDGAVHIACPALMRLALICSALTTGFFSFF
jgi:hypothetical protein